ncbi:hypothetical protein [Psychrobacter frigidicola]|uniref:hypothetical protein n=1 Tax=Psychrobacter frigidicola TaxID=45611 RepID=UPI001919DB36|nr:hypothetical protein [Psychrobacter frigidicola]
MSHSYFNINHFKRSYLKNSYLKGSLLLGVALILSSCSNTSLLTKNNGTQTLTQTQLIPAKSPTLVTAVKPVAHIVDWQEIEAAADKKYQDEPLADYYFNILTEAERNAAPWFYAQEFGVSIPEAQRRLLLQGISSPLIEAIAERLGATVAAIYYDNNDPDEFSIKVTTLSTVKAIPPKYVYHFKQKEFKSYSFPIYIQASSDKAHQQIFALQEKAWPEILKRYPDTQSIGFSPMTNTINVSIYRKTPDEVERQRIEAELTELVGHPVVVEFLKSRLTTL